MPCGALILVETSLAGNLGAAMRVAANFGVPRVELVRCRVELDRPEVRAWSCGALEHLAIRSFATLDEAAAPYHTLVATSSVRGRENQPVFAPQAAADAISARGFAATALVFGNETSGLNRADLDRCDLVVRIPTRPSFPVLNLAQAIAILLGYLSTYLEPEGIEAPTPAPEEQVAALMDHLRSSLLTIGFLDPRNPQRMLRKLRRLFGRAGLTENEVAILRGVCRQIDWAARTGGRSAGRTPEAPPTP